MLRILYVEDDANLRKTVIRMFRRFFADVDVKLAESVDEAIDHLKTSTSTAMFDLVVSDYDLLGTRKGSELLAWIRVHMSYLEPRFVFLSGNEAAGKHGVLWLEKPCESSVLHAALNERLSID